MTEDSRSAGFLGEDIQGAPPVESIAAIQARRLNETITLNRYLYQQVQQMVNMLIAATDLQAILEVILVSMPRHFNFQVAELWLYDPEGVLASLVPNGQRYGQHLQLHGDAFVMQELYELEPDVLLIDATDSRMFQVLKSDSGVQQAVLLPLSDGGRMLGSLHLGMAEASFSFGEAEEALLAQLAAVTSLCFKNAVSGQQLSQLTLLDPLTQISNLRGFEKDIAREIARARRADKPFSVLMIEIDEYEDLYQHYGDTTGQFVIKKVAERLSSALRATDHMARLSDSRIALLVASSGEVSSLEIAERVRKDIEHFAIDDGRGAILYVTLSVGVVTWEPEHYPAVDMAQLARQMEAVATKAVDTARSRNGNQVSVSRLTTLMV